MSKITILTAYDFNTARALAEASVDYILVGDSLGMVGLGYSNTQKVTLGEMVICTRAVKRGAPEANIISDYPFKELKKSIIEMLKSAQQLVKAGAKIIKVENASKESLEFIKELRAHDIEVMGHIGYTPQSFEKPILVKDQEKLLSDAKALEAIGVMGIVLEMIPSNIAQVITESISVPTIGIGAGPHTSGQVLVSDDMLGRYDLINPKFLRRYSNQYQDMVKSFKEYINDVQSGSFPSETESY